MTSYENNSFNNAAAQATEGVDNPGCQENRAD